MTIQDEAEEIATAAFNRPGFFVLDPNATMARQWFDSRTMQGLPDGSIVRISQQWWNGKVESFSWTVTAP